MKHKNIQLLILCGMLSFSAFAQSALLTTEKDKISREVSDVIDQIYSELHQKDIQAFSQHFLSSPEFNFIHVDGEVMNFQEFKQAADDAITPSNSVTFEFVDKTVKILNPDIALVILVYTPTFTFDDRVEIYPETGSTFLLRKMGDRWKVIHFHESIQFETKIVKQINQ